MTTKNIAFMALDKGVESSEEAEQSSNKLSSSENYVHFTELSKLYDAIVCVLNSLSLNVKITLSLLKRAKNSLKRDTLN